MKASLIFRLSTVLVLLSFSLLAHAQAQPASPALPGYWNLETNLTTRDYTIVRFYNGQDQLVYEETLPNLCLDLGHRKSMCRRTSAQLNLALQHVLRSPIPMASNGLLAAQFGQDHRMQRVYAVR